MSEQMNQPRYVAWYLDIDQVEKIVSLEGVELEGAFPRDMQNVQHDGSVNVVDDDGGDCEEDYNCDCSECYRCSNCDDWAGNCCCSGCRVCSNCYEQQEYCNCGTDESNWHAGCPDCKDRYEEQERKIPCDEHIEQYWQDNHQYSCQDTGNAYRSCDGECGCSCQCEACIRGGGDLINGEVVSAPIKPSQVYEYIMDNYPTEVNSSCGCHKHMSFHNNRDYCVALSPELTAHIIKRSFEWGLRLNIKNRSFWDRVNDNRSGGGTWCKNEYHAYEQLTAREKYHTDRYTVVNYCYPLHGTLEVRLPPMFKNPELTAKFHNFITGVVCEFVTKNRDSLKPHRKSIIKEVL